MRKSSEVILKGREGRKKGRKGGREREWGREEARTLGCSLVVSTVILLMGTIATEHLPQGRNSHTEALEVPSHRLTNILQSW